MISNLDKNGGFDIEVCEGSQLLAVRRGRELCYVDADGAAGRSGAVVLLGGGSRLKSDVERCMANSKKYRFAREANEAILMETSERDGDNYSLWGAIGLKELCDRIEGKEPRANETVCYITPNGNRIQIMRYVSENIGRQGSCIKHYKPGGDRIEVTVEGSRREIAEELRMFGISRDDVDLF